MITIIIPSFNQKDYLFESIESALLQNCPVIVVDDGSTDGSLEIAKNYECDRLKVISQVNKGLASARNTALMHVQTDYFLPLDSDDILMGGCVAQLEEVIKETNAEMVAPSFVCIGESNQEVILGKNVTLEEMKTANRLPYFTAMRTQFAKDIGGYSPKMVWGYEDYHFSINMMKRGAKVVTIPEPLVKYRVRKNSMISNSVKHHDELMSIIYKDFYE